MGKMELLLNIWLQLSAALLARQSISNCEISGLD
jgi:hypothetical protein